MRPRPPRPGGSEAVAAARAPALAQAALELPLTAAELARLRLRLAKTVPSAGTGAHLRRRHGQALEFREFRPYAMGDDIRRVDWVASARRGGPRDWVVRSYEAEERRTLAILVDARPAMRLPAAAPKLLLALWAMQALAAAAGAARDAVILGALFAPGPGDAAPLAAAGAGALAAARRLAAALAAPDPRPLSAVPEAQTGAIIARLPPASAVAVITDGLFQDPGGAVGRLMLAAQRGRRQAVVLELDSWPMERAALAPGPLRLAAVEGRDFGEGLHAVTPAALEAAEAAMARHRRALRRDWARGGLVWPEAPLAWPAVLPEGGAAAVFRAGFPRAPALASLLSRAG